MRDDELRQAMESGDGTADGQAGRATGRGGRTEAHLSTPVAANAASGGEHSPSDGDLDEMLDAAMDDVAQEHAPESSNVVQTQTWVLLRYGPAVSSPRALDHARARLALLQATGEHGAANTVGRIVAILEALQAEDAGQLLARVRLVQEFQATMDALNAFVGASSIEAAYDALLERHTVLATDLAEELLEGKLLELLDAGNEEAGRQLERGPLRLLRDVRVHGAEEGYQVFLARDREQEAAQNRLGFLMAAIGPDVVAAVDAVLGAENAEQLEAALVTGYALLISPEAVMILDEAATITRAAGTSEDEAARHEYLAAVLSRLSLLAHDAEPLPMRDQIWMALHPVIHD